MDLITIIETLKGDKVTKIKFYFYYSWFYFVKDYTTKKTTNKYKDMQKYSKIFHIINQ